MRSGYHTTSPGSLFEERSATFPKCVPQTKRNGCVPRPQTHAGQPPALSALWDNVDGLNSVHLDTFHDLNLRNYLQQDLTPHNGYAHDVLDSLRRNSLFHTDKVNHWIKSLRKSTRLRTAQRALPMELKLHPSLQVPLPRIRSLEVLRPLPQTRAT